jgi:hypothetical protein
VSETKGLLLFSAVVRDADCSSQRHVQRAYGHTPTSQWSERAHRFTFTLFPRPYVRINN